MKTKVILRSRIRDETQDEFASQASIENHRKRASNHRETGEPGRCCDQHHLCVFVSHSADGPALYDARQRHEACAGLELNYESDITATATRSSIHGDRDTLSVRIDCTLGVDQIARNEYGAATYGECA